jgi:hypothetical protein
MANPISDRGAVNFSANFYQVLASGGSIKQAFEGARLVTRMQGREVFGKSDLIIREGANINEPFINLLPSLPQVNESTTKNKPVAGSVTQNASGGAKVGAQVVSTGDNGTNNTTVSFQ